MKTAPSSPSAKRQSRNARQLKRQGGKVAAATTTPRSLDELTPVHRRAAGIDVGSAESRRTRKVNNRASTILRLAAVAVGKTDTWLGHFYRRVRARRGAPKAVTATARKLACIIYHMLKYGDEFAWPDAEDYEAKAKDHRLRRLRKEAKSFGFELKELQQAA